MNFLGTFDERGGETEKFIECFWEKLMGVTRLFGQISFSLNFTHSNSIV